VPELLYLLGECVAGCVRGAKVSAELLHGDDHPGEGEE